MRWAVPTRLEALKSRHEKRGLAASCGSESPKDRRILPQTRQTRSADNGEALNKMDRYVDPWNMAEIISLIEADLFKERTVALCKSARHDNQIKPRSFQVQFMSKPCTSRVGVMSLKYEAAVHSPAAILYP